MDIIIPWQTKPTGFLASTINEYVSALYQALTLSYSEQLEMRNSARDSVSVRFSQDSFCRGFIDRLQDCTRMNID